MGIFREAVSRGLEFVREEVVPLRTDLMKAGILKPDQSAYDPKANLTDPTNYGSMNFGYKEKWALLDYRKCRQITYSDPIVAAIIQVRINQVADFGQPQPDKYKLGFKIALRDAEKQPTPAQKKEAQEIQQFIINAGVPESFEDTPERKKRDSFEQFLRKIARDSLTFDQINFEITPRRDGRPYSFHAVDAESIRIVPDEKEKREYFGGAGTYGAQDFANIMPNHWDRKSPFNEFKPKHPKYVQIINGIIRHTFDEWEMAFGVRNPRSDLLAHGYGYSEIEMLVTAITSHMNAEAYNRRFFTQGATVKGILSFEGAVPPDQLEAFRRQWYMQSTGITNAWKTPIMAMGEKTKLNWTSLHANNREMEFGKWMEYCIKSICGVFQMDPVEIGFDIGKQTSGASGGSGGLSGDDHANRVLYSQEKGLRPLLRHVQSLLNEYIVYRLNPDFEFQFVGLNATSEKEELEQTMDKAKTFQTVNEIRAEHDLPPIPPMDKLKSLGDVILDSGWIQALSGQLSQAAMAEQGVGPDGQPLGPDAGPEGEGADGEDGDGDELENELSGQGYSDDELENMSVEELEAELARLDQTDDNESTIDSGDLPSKSEKKQTKKSLELEL